MQTVLDCKHTCTREQSASCHSTEVDSPSLPSKHTPICIGKNENGGQGLGNGTTSSRSRYPTGDTVRGGGRTCQGTENKALVALSLEAGAWALACVGQEGRYGHSSQWTENKALGAL